MRRLPLLALLLPLLLLLVPFSQAATPRQALPTAGYLPLVFQGQGAGIPTATLTPSATPTSSPTATSTPSATATRVPVLLQNGSFEDTPPIWKAERSFNVAPIIRDDAPPGAHSGSFVAWLGGVPENDAYVSQSVTVNKPYLVYWRYLASNDDCQITRDQAIVALDNGDGAIEGDEIVESYWLCSGTNTGGWARNVVNVGKFQGQDRVLRFQVRTGASGNSNFFLDDVSFER
jgi:hypothetical protein